MDDLAKKATGQLGSYVYSSRDEIGDMTRERSTADVLKDIVGNVQEIIRSEVRLAKAETTIEVVKAKSAVTLLGAGVACGLLGAAFLMLAAVYALTLVMAAWLAALIVGAAVAIIGAILISNGLGEWNRVNPKPERTIETVKENVEWMKNQTK